MSSSYVDGVTPLDGVHMNALQQKVEKAAANGYASLDATGKVPVAQLPAQPLPYGVTLPSTPTDGQEAVLVDSVTNPTYQWRLRYNAGSTSAYKWEFVGGSEMYAETPTADTTASGTTSNLTGGPSLVIPRAGDYLIEVEATASASVPDGQCFLTAGDSSVPGSNLIAGSTFGQQENAGRWSGVHVHGRALALPAGMTLATKANTSGGATATYQARRLLVRPIRVS